MIKENNVEIEWKAFELRPEGVEIPPKPEEYMNRAKESVKAMSEQYGLEMHWNDKSKHSRRALEGAKFAEVNGLAHEYHIAVFKAQFQESKDINNPENLVEIAKQVGLDEIMFKQALETRRFEEDVLNDHQEAQQLGVTAVPCFIYGNRGIMGAQSYEALVNLLEQE